MKKIRIICLCFALVLLVGAISCMFLVGSTWAKYSAASEGMATLRVTYGEVGCRGGTATCTQRKICEICGNEYGDYGHTGNKVWSYSESGHWQLWSCCGSISGDIGEHTYVDNKCTSCGRLNHTHTPVAVPAKEATCTEEGNIAYQACECGKMWNADGTIEILPTSVTIPASGHKWYLATCLNPKTCQNCGETEGVALEHNLQTLEAVEPTCTSTGLTEGKYCTICNTVTVPQQVREMTAHNTKVIPAVAATCTQGGMTAGEICKVCGTVTVLPVATEAAGHSKTTLPAVAATCTATGLTEGEKCTVCGLITVEQEVTDALGHHEVATPALEPTCTQAGHTAGTRCDRAGCNTVLVAQETRPATGHTEVAMADVAPTCTDKGYEGGKQCSVCHTITVARTELAALGHLNDVNIARVEPTCADIGLTAGVQCSRCGTLTTPQTIIPATGHTEETLAGRAPTCLSVGISEGKRCSVCKDILVAQTILPKSGHTETTLSAKEATCTATGLTEGKQCTVCGVITVAQTETSALGHLNDVTLERVEPTCTATGLTAGVKCSRCQAITTAQTAIPAKGHSWSDATCTTPKTCSVCKATTGSALGHSWGSGTVTTAATCSKTGVRTYTCSTCKSTKTEDIAKLAHTYSGNCDTSCNVCGGTRSTSTSHTYDNACDTTCNTCGTTRSITHSYNAGYVTKAPTCTATGTKTYTCKVCSGTKTDTIPATGHAAIYNNANGAVSCANCNGGLSNTPTTFINKTSFATGTLMYGNGSTTGVGSKIDNVNYMTFKDLGSPISSVGSVQYRVPMTVNSTIGRYVVVKYRITGNNSLSSKNQQVNYINAGIYVGRGDNLAGPEYTLTKGSWSYAIFDMNGYTTLIHGMLVFIFDNLGASGDSIDVECVATFNNLDYAKTWGQTVVLYDGIIDQASDIKNNFGYGLWNSAVYADTVQINGTTVSVSSFTADTVKTLSASGTITSVLLRGHANFTTSAAASTPCLPIKRIGYTIDSLDASDIVWKQNPPAAQADLPGAVGANATRYDFTANLNVEAGHTVRLRVVYELQNGMIVVAANYDIKAT